jgi:hypothetical protein
MINIDIEVNGNISLKAAHDLAHKVEGTIKKQVEDVFDVAIHVEPLGRYHKRETIRTHKRQFKLVLSHKKLAISKSNWFFLFIHLSLWTFF